MKKNFTVFAICSFVLSVLIFGFSYVLYHYTTADGHFTSQWSPEPGKPLVTELFAILGVLFLFCGLAGLLVRIVFFRKGGEKDKG